MLFSLDATLVRCETISLYEQKEGNVAMESTRRGIEKVHVYTHVKIYKIYSSGYNFSFEK